MALNLTRSGKVQFLKKITADVLLLHLYRNKANYADDLLTLEKLEENEEEGYATHLLYPNRWSISADDRGLVVAQHEPVTVRFEGTVDCSYGYFVTDTREGKVLWIEPFESDGFWSLGSRGGHFVVNTRLILV